MRHYRWSSCALVLLAALVGHLAAASIATAQARATVASLRTQYNTVRTQAKPTAELKAQFYAIEAQIARAAKLGRTGEVRRLYSQGIALAGGRVWTPQVEFANSLALRTERVGISQPAITCSKGAARNSTAHLLARWPDDACIAYT